MRVNPNWFADRIDQKPSSSGILSGAPAAWMHRRYMSQPNSIRFDGWVLRTDVGDLTKDDHTIRLRDEPLQILQELLTHAGAVVTREALIARLWPEGGVVFDTMLKLA